MLFFPLVAACYSAPRRPTSVGSRRRRCRRRGFGGLTGHPWSRLEDHRQGKDQRLGRAGTAALFRRPKGWIDELPKLVAGQFALLEKHGGHGGYRRPALIHDADRRVDEPHFESFELRAHALSDAGELGDYPVDV
jgi:hypothetical protein